MSAPTEIDSPVVIVGIDEASFAELNLQWPWPRSLHGNLINSLTRAGASVIAFNVVFAEPSNPVDDSFMAQQIAQSKEVVLAADQSFVSNDYVDQLIDVEPLEQFMDAGAKSGLVGVQPDSDMVVRKFPTMANAFWRKIVTSYIKQISATNQTIDNLDIPKNARLRYLGPPHSFHYASYYQALHAEQM